MEDKLNVFIVGDYRKGIANGLAEFNYQTAHLLRDTFIFHFIEFDSVKNGNFSHVETIDNLYIHRFGAKRLFRFKLPGTFNEWISSLPAKRTLFHLSHIYNFNNYLISRMLVRFGIPYIITPHDSYVYCSSYASKRPFLKRVYRTIFTSLIDKYVFDHAATIHDLTSKYSSCIRKLTSSPIVVVANQVEDIRISFDPSAITPTVSFIGRSSIISKGIDLAIQSFGLFKSNSPVAKGVSFVMVGPADEEQDLARHQISLNAGLDIGRDVIFTGGITEDRRNQILAGSKAYLQLSRFEGFGLSVVQALCCYKPVIISAEIPIAEKVRKHNAGFVVATKEEASRALDHIFGLPDKDYEELAQNARRCYDEEFHPSVIKPKLVEMFRHASSGNY